MAKKTEDPAILAWNYKFETHDADGNVTWDISREEWRTRHKRLEGIVGPCPDRINLYHHDKDTSTPIMRKSALYTSICGARFANAVSCDATIDKFGCEPRNFSERAHLNGAIVS